MKTIIQQKIKERFGSVQNAHYSGFLHTDGTITESSFIHEQICEMVGHTLFAYLKEGGIRVKIHGEELAIETYVKWPTEIQITKLKQIIRDNNFGFLTVNLAGKYKQKQSFHKISARDLMECLKCR